MEDPPELSPAAAGGAPDDDIVRRVMRLTWRALQADAAGYAPLGGAMPPSRPQRFFSTAALEQTRRDVVDTCRAADADADLREYLSTHWLDRFAPMPM
jgi:hypothetical protein